MGWFDFLSGRKNKYRIDGREIIIVNESNIGKKTLYEIECSILSICKTQPIAANFPKITFKLKSTVEDKNVANLIPWSWINVDDFIKGEMIVYINTPIFIARPETRLRMIVHELTHLQQELISNYLQKRLTESKRLAEAISRQMVFKNKTDIPELRRWFRRYIELLPSEGIAKFSEKVVYGQINFSRSQFMEGYKKSEASMMSFPEDSPNYVKHLQTSSYTVGLHMVYTILYLDHEMTLDLLAGMNPFQFIKKYEACMKAAGLKPIVSLTSGKGLFDYKKMVGKLWKMAIS